MLAATKDNIDIIKYLLSKNADLKQINKDGWNAFQIAVREGKLDIVSYMLQFNYHLAFTVKTKNLRTPLHTACLHGHIDIVRLLLEKINDLSSDPNKHLLMLDQRDSCGITPFMDGINGDNINIVKYLLENYEISIFERDNLENTCLHLAAQAGSLKTFDYLFSKYFNSCKNGVDKSDLTIRFAKTLNKINMTPLHSACKNDKPQIIDLMLKYLSSDDDDDGDKLEQLKILIHQKDIHQRSAIDICKLAGFKQALMILDKYS